LDNLCEHFKEYNDEKINIRQLALSIRLQRFNAVESWQQYKFIIYTLLQRYNFGDTKVTKENVDNKLNLLNTYEKEEGKTKMEIEYRVCIFLGLLKKKELK
jgi:hypothetical protein